MSAETQDFRKAHFRTPDDADDNWFSTFRELARSTMQIEIDRSPAAPFRMATTIRCLPGVALAEADVSQMQVRNLPGPDTNDDIILIAEFDGEGAHHEDGAAITLDVGRVLAFANDRAGRLDYHTPVKARSIRIARRLLEPLVPNLDRALRRPIATDTPAMRLLSAYVECLQRESDIPSPEMQRIVVMHLLDLVAMVLGASGEARAAAEERGIRAARLAAVKNSIYANLSRTDLSVGDIAASQNVTPRYVQLLFESENTTFTDFLVGERLMRAHRLLIDPRAAGRPIHEIAFEVGFGDLSYFNRTFRRRFNKTPSQVREEAGG